MVSSHPEIWKLPATRVISALYSGELQPSDALAGVLSRHVQVEPRIAALPTICQERAGEQARRLDRMPPSERGPLCGLPITVKDLTPVAGVRTTFGSALHADHVPEHSDRLIRLLESRGAVVYAKSNTPEFGTGGITFNGVFPSTRSPRNTRFSSGGSSGGAAASLAAGSAWLSLGSDMAGSLRTPAAFCGVCSLRPSPGRILEDSEFTPFDVLGASGPMARDIQDLALFTDALMHEPPGQMQQAVGKPAAPGRVAISPDLGVTRVDSALAMMLGEAADAIADAGVEVKHDHPDLDTAEASFDILRAHGYAVGLEEALFAHPGVMKPEVEWNIRKGLELSGEQIRIATRQQGQLVARANAFMADYDLLICPATSVVAVDAALRYPGSDNNVPYADYYRWLAIAYAITMTALPVITLPWKILANGMPGAIQLVGKPGNEYALFQHAAWLEGLSGWDATPVDPTQAPGHHPEGGGL